MTRETDGGMFEVLIYLFENYLQDNVEDVRDHETIADELHAAGFPPAEVSKAFDWLKALGNLRERGGAPVTAAECSIRHYTPHEMRRLNMSARGFLLFLEQIGVLDCHLRELVVDRVLALDDDAIDLDDLKWVILIVLFSQPGREQAYAFVEDLVYEGARDNLH